MGTGPRADPGGAGAARPLPGGAAHPGPGRDLFDDAYYRLMAGFHPEAETRREVAALRELVALALDDRVLDLGCGWGRHLTLLRGAGHRVVGVDASPDLLRRVAGPARPGPGAPVPRPPVVAGDMAALPFRPGCFDVVVNLGTSLGLCLDDRDALAVVAEVRRVLRPGGRLLLEGMHRDDVVAHYAERDAWTLDDGTRVRARRRFDALRGVSHEVLRWQGPAGAGRKRHTLRLRTATELAGLVEAAALDVVAAYGGWEQESFHRTAERLILLARKP
jgi:SAM-dependent methyltransferase